MCTDSAVAEGYANTILFSSDGEFNIFTKQVASLLFLFMVMHVTAACVINRLINYRLRSIGRIC